MENKVIKHAGAFKETPSWGNVYIGGSTFLKISDNQAIERKSSRRFWYIPRHEVLIEAQEWCPTPAVSKIIDELDREEKEKRSNKTFAHNFDTMFCVNRQEEDSETVTGAQMRQAIIERLARLSDEELQEACGHCSQEEDPEEELE